MRCGVSINANYGILKHTDNVSIPLVALCSLQLSSLDNRRPGCIRDGLAEDFTRLWSQIPGRKGHSMSVASG